MQHTNELSTKKKQSKAATIRTSLSLQVSGQTLAELQENYDDILVQTALELRCECEFLTLPSASLQNGSLSNGAGDFNDYYEGRHADYDGHGGNHTSDNVIGNTTGGGSNPTD